MAVEYPTTETDEMTEERFNRKAKHYVEMAEKQGIKAAVEHLLKIIEALEEIE